MPPGLARRPGLACVQIQTACMGTTRVCTCRFSFAECAASVADMRVGTHAWPQISDGGGVRAPLSEEEMELMQQAKERGNSLFGKELVSRMHASRNGAGASRNGAGASRHEAGACRNGAGTGPVHPGTGQERGRRMQERGRRVRGRGRRMLLAAALSASPMQRAPRTAEPATC